MADPVKPTNAMAMQMADLKLIGCCGRMVFPFLVSFGETIN
jgi:hypothetical protein